MSKVVLLLIITVLVPPAVAELADPSREVDAQSPTDAAAQLEKTASPEDEEPSEPEELGIKRIKGKEASLTLSVGSSQVREFPFELGSISVAEAGLFDYVRISEGGKVFKLRFIGKNSGTTDMTIYDTSNTPRITLSVRVTREDMGEVMKQLEDLLGDIEGLKIRALGGMVLLDGEILLPKDMLRIFRVTSALKDRDPKKKELGIKNLVTLSKMTMNILAERIEREIGSPEITARVVNNNLFLEGTAENNFEADRALEIAKTYLPEVLIQNAKGEGGIEFKPKNAGGEGGMPTIIDMMRVRPTQAAPPAEDIKITMNFVELNNEYEQFFNFEWKPLASDNSTVKYDSSAGELTANLVATISSLIPKLNSAKQHGHARVLKQQQIVVRDRSDSPASVESSIAYYARVQNDKGETALTAIPVQNALKVKAAKIPGSDSIDLGIQINLQSLLGINQGSPIVASNSMQTQIIVKNGDSAALGGYAIDQALSGYNREPNRSAASGGGASTGGSTPLFNFQRSKSFKRDKQQHVIFVTPEVIKTASAANESITRTFRLNAGER